MIRFFFYVFSTFFLRFFYVLLFFILLFFCNKIKLNFWVLVVEVAAEVAAEVAEKYDSN